jgi:hypothetical protein
MLRELSGLGPTPVTGIRSTKLSVWVLVVVLALVAVEPQAAVAVLVVLMQQVAT